MPHYQFTHHTPLSDDQKDEIARRVTDLHCEVFPLTPKFFVNVFFKPLGDEVAYCGGKGRRGNRLVAHIRTSPARTREDYVRIASQVGGIWKDVVGAAKEDDIRIWIVGGILAGQEWGMLMPVAGEERAWIQEILPEVRRKAEEGDEDYHAILEDIQIRGLDQAA